MRRAPRNAPLWIVVGAAVVVLAAALSTNDRGPRAVKAVSLDVVPSEVPPALAAVIDDAVSEPQPRLAPLMPQAKAALDRSVVATPPSMPATTLASPEPVGAAGMIVGIDPETGKLGMPSREFRDALRGDALRESPALSRSMTGLQVIHRPDGSRMIDLRGRFQDYAVMRLTPDGRKEQVCVQGPEVEAALGIKVGASARDPETAAPDDEAEANTASESQER